ncbi:SDR family oxidoreductase [Stieleria marina]|uniref:Enoyl-[acyl-carrier-protein] reductase [NADPH] FabL n=1 Tax=Stieleria marina TaxID=1930275 RepID=A0A517P1Y4_9BACT|nr:Enoyl-[acyl-carrier-protein] reductase [NADPH] FabL [Planctomycetes bacterium K23_9]
MNHSNFSRVVECIAKTTRYPVELLTPDADLENDLGIDSVKRLEIVVALSDEFGLRLDLEERSAAIRTIQHVATWVEDIARREGSSDAPESDKETTNGAASESTTGAAESDGHSESNGHAGSNGRSGSNGYESSGTTNHDAPANRVTSFLPPSERDPVAPPSGLGEPSGHSEPKGRSEPNGHGNSNVHSESNAHSEQPPIVHAANPSSVPQPHFGNGSNGVAQPAVGTNTAKPLAGRVALVTGSGRGVGQTIARLLASRGATVVINSFHSREQGEQTAAEINQSGGSAIHLWGSVANPRHVDQIFEQIEQQFGRLDILICNASDGRIGPFMELTLDDWDKAFRTNVTGHHQCAVKATPLMRASGGGSIVTMSAVGSNGFIDGLGSQGVVKAAVETMTRYLACELGQFGIRVNCVAGGPVYGDLLSKFPDARATQDHWESITPDGQLCSPMDLAKAIAFLVGDEAKGINGSVWMVDHGFSAMADGRPLRATARENESERERVIFAT